MVAGVKSPAELELSAPARCRGVACSFATVEIASHLAAVSLFLIFKSVNISNSSCLSLLFVK
jgi:hypothetical protein